jgi:hypothetical protein
MQPPVGQLGSAQVVPGENGGTNGKILHTSECGETRSPGRACTDTLDG